MTARILDCSAEDYYADPCDKPSLSYSIASELINRSPLHAWYLHPRLGGGGKPETRAMHLGQVFDALLLGGRDRIAPLDYDDFRTNAAKKDRKDLADQGLIPILSHKLAEAEPIADLMLERLARFGIEFTGENQVAIQWTEQSSYGPVLCRGRLDHLIVNGRATIYDLKSTECAKPAKCQRSAVDYGLDIQAAAYTRAVEALHPEFSGRTDFVDLFCETSMPVGVAPIRARGTMMCLGEMRWKRAVEEWARCLHTYGTEREWPGYTETIIDGEAPEWALAREMENSNAANV